MLLYTRLLLLLLHLLTKGEATLALLVLYLIPMKPSVLWLWLLHLIPRLLLVLLLWRRRSLIVGHCSHGLLVV